jgi:hypothetical protein
MNRKDQKIVLEKLKYDWMWTIAHGKYEKLSENVGNVA